MTDTEIIVVGAGVVGCAIARALAPERSVVLLDADAVGSGASRRSLGLVTTAAAYADNRAVAEYALSWFRELDVPFDERVSLEPASPDETDLYRRRATRLSEAGGAVRFVDPAEIRGEHPRLDLPSAGGVLRFDEIGLVDPGDLVEFLASDAHDRGVEIRTGVEVTGLRTGVEVTGLRTGVEVTGARTDRAEGPDGPTVTGVETTAGPISAETVVVAAGWRTADLLADHPMLPVRPYRTQAIELSLSTPLPPSFPVLWRPDEGLYFREADGDLWVGGGAHAVDDPAGASDKADRTVRQRIVDTVPEYVAGTETATIRSDWAGVDGGTPDGRPIIDTPVSGPEDLVVATGFHGMGIGLAPIAAAVVRSVVNGESPPFDPAPFALGRFEDRSRSFDFLSIDERR